MTTPRFKVSLVASLLAVLDGVWVVDRPRRLRDEEYGKQVRLALTAKAKALKEDIDRRFPLGSPKANVVAYLHNLPTDWRGESGDEHWFSVGKAPSGVW